MERVHRQQLWKNLVSGRTIEKGAELAETWDMHTQSAPSKVNDTRNRKFVIDKTGGAGHLVDQKSTEGQETVLGKTEGQPGEQPKKLPQMGALRPHVDVTSQEPPVLVKEKQAQFYALPSRNLYSLDRYDQVKAATSYFMENWKFIPPEERHEYCQNLVKRASALSIVTDPLIEKYGSATYAPEHDIDICLDARRGNLLDEDHIGILDKLASHRAFMPPEDFAVALREFDKMACLEQHYGNIPDAYYSTFGKTAKKSPQAETSKTDPDEVIVIGNEYLPLRKLVEFVNNNDRDIRNRFGWEFTTALHDDPKGIFDSLPRDQKLVLMRMASVSDPLQGETSS